MSFLINHMATMTVLQTTTMMMQHNHRRQREEDERRKKTRRRVKLNVNIRRAYEIFNNRKWLLS